MIKGTLYFEAAVMMIPPYPISNMNPRLPTQRATVSSAGWIFPGKHLDYTARGDMLPFASGYNLSQCEATLVQCRDQQLLHKHHMSRLWWMIRKLRVDNTMIYWDFHNEHKYMGSHWSSGLKEIVYSYWVIASSWWFLCLSLIVVRFSKFVVVGCGVLSMLLLFWSFCFSFLPLWSHLYGSPSLSFRRPYSTMASECPFSFCQILGRRDQRC